MRMLTQLVIIIILIIYHYHYIATITAKPIFLGVL